MKGASGRRAQHATVTALSRRGKRATIPFMVIMAPGYSRTVDCNGSLDPAVSGSCYVFQT